jgi:hypothetical protein
VTRLTARIIGFAVPFVAASATFRAAYRSGNRSVRASRMSSAVVDTGFFSDFIEGPIIGGVSDVILYFAFEYS